MNQNIDILISILKNNINDCEEKDQVTVNEYCNELKKIKNEVPNDKLLENIKNINNYLDIKYDFYNELSYYFDPLYVHLNDIIHKKYVDELRKNNRKKRESENKENV